jgi:DNA-binding NarL/FixJ family response regulator
MGVLGKQRVGRVLVVDDHPIVREGIAQLIAQQTDLIMCGEATDTAGARRAVRDLAPDVMVVDLSLGRESGIDLIEALRDEAPGLPMLALSMHEETLYARRVLAAGARGYIMKQEGTVLLLTAIRTVLAGEVYVSAEVNASLLRSMANKPVPSEEPTIAALTNRELQIYRLVGAGLGTREIAVELHLSTKTVESHRARIKEKLGLTTATELVVHAAQGLADKRS